VIGLYGVMAATVAQNTRQLALRMALGADPSHVRRLVLTSGAAVTATGIVVGAVCALAATRLMGYLLYHVSPRDPATFAGALALVVLGALAACIVPARRAIRTDPLQVLRA